MKHPAELLTSFDRSWTEFSKAWKNARAKGSEKLIHALRVSMRRLIANLELTRSLSKDTGISKLQRRLKRVFKSMGPLRDLQVQVKNVAELRQVGPIVDFKKSLARRERRQIAAIRKDLKRGAKRRLTERVKEVRSEFVRLHDKLGDEKIHSSVERLLKVRRNEFLRMRKRFKPADEETLHQMRIALKKLRYTVEAAQPILGDSAKEQARKMHAFQQLMGDTRDVQLLRVHLEKWAGKRGKKIAIVPALERLEEKRQDLMQKIVTAAADLDSFLPQENLKPAAEQTFTVAAGETEAKRMHALAGR